MRMLPLRILRFIKKNGGMPSPRGGLDRSIPGPSFADSYYGAEEPSTVVIRAAAFRDSTGEVSPIATLTIKKERSAVPVRVLTDPAGSPRRYIL